MKKFPVATILRLTALVAVVFFAWALARDRLDAGNWNQPVDYHGDNVEFIGWIKTASEGGFIPFVSEGDPRLGAPYHAVWYDYPASEKFYICFLGLVAKLFGLFPACNFGMVFAHILSALSFYACCRYLRYSRVWSFAGAALFSLTYYNFMRSLGHLHLACSYTLPFAILSGWLVLAGRRIRPWNSAAWICLVTAFVMGLSAPYNLNMYLQLLGFALLAQYFGARRKANLRVGALCIAAAIGGFLLINARTLLYEWAHGKNTLALARNYFETELYALKPIEFFVPPATHRFPAFASVGGDYLYSSRIKGEVFSPYLGVIVAAGLIWVFAELFILLARRWKRRRTVSAHGLQIGWVIGYAAVGGVNCLIALGGFQLFRATNRYSIFVSLLVLFFLVSRLSRLSRRWPAPWRFAAAGAVLLFGLADQLPAPRQGDATETIIKTTASDRDYGAALEAKLPAGAMVFELPVMVFPEAPPIRRVSGYEMMRPFLFTKTLRFSYGAVRGRPREDWQWEVEKMPAAEMVATLEKYGFSAIHLNRKCYADQGVELVKQINAAGRAQVIEDNLREQVCVLLNPSAAPELPHTDERALLRFDRGWTIKNQTPGENPLWASTQNNQWAGGDAAISFFSESREMTGYNLHCLIGSADSRIVKIVIDGREQWSGQIQPRTAVPVDLSLVGKHGYNRVYFKTDAPPVRHEDPPVPMAFNVFNLQVMRSH